jgi:hypothetical protein
MNQRNSATRMAVSAGLGAIVTALFCLGSPTAARASGAIEDTVVLDPYDPVGEVRFHHHYGCGEDCSDRRERDGDRGHDRDRSASAPPCSENCSDDEHWEHSWRIGDRYGEEWWDGGRLEHVAQSAETGQQQGFSDDRDRHDRERHDFSRHDSDHAGQDRHDTDHPDSDHHDGDHHDSDHRDHP